MGRISLKNGEPHRNRTCNLLIKSLFVSVLDCVIEAK